MSKLPKVERATFIAALLRFDAEFRETEDWQGWHESKAHRHAIFHEGKLYPVKFCIALAANVEVNSFSGGPEANTYATKRGFELVALHPDEDTAFFRGYHITELELGERDGQPVLARRHADGWEVTGYETRFPTIEAAIEEWKAWKKASKPTRRRIATA